MVVTEFPPINAAKALMLASTEFKVDSGEPTPEVGVAAVAVNEE